MAPSAGNSPAPVAFGARLLGRERPCLMVAEIGINHSGDVGKAIALIDAAKAAGADCAKFQAGDPERYVNRSAWDTPRQLEDGRTVPYIEYRKSMELSDRDFQRIDRHCQSIDLPWFVSPLDGHSVERFEQYDLPAYKVASPKLTDTLLLQRLASSGRTLLLSTGMSTVTEIHDAVELLPRDRLVLLHCTSEYPCPVEHLNLRMIPTLQQEFPDIPIGYSGHESNVGPSVTAATLGACVIERHFSLDRTSWGSDQAASLEPHGFRTLVERVRNMELSLGDGIKRVLEGERTNMAKFRSAA